MRRILAFAVVALIAFAAPAAAHSDTGVIALEVTNSGTEYTFTARLTYDNDAESADPGATVTLSIAGQDAGLFPPETMTEGDPGEFSATVNLATPGTYTATVTSQTPDATTEQTITVPDAESTTTATTETATTEKPEVSTTSAATADGGDDDVPWLGIVAALLAAVVAIALVIVFVKRRQQDRTTPPTGTPPASPTG